MSSRVYKQVLRVLCLFTLVAPNISYAESYIDKAEYYKKQNNLYKSNYYYISSILNRQDLEQAHYGLAVNQYASREYSKALTNLKQLLEINPDHTQALILQARIFEAIGDKPALASVAKQIEALPVQDEAVIRALDSAYTLLGKSDKAQAYSKQLNQNARNIQQLQVNTGRARPGQ